MEQRRTRVAVVGTGAWWGREHARVFSSPPDGQVVGFCYLGRHRVLDRVPSLHDSNVIQPS